MYHLNYRQNAEVVFQDLNATIITPLVEFSRQIFDTFSNKFNVVNGIRQEKFAARPKIEAEFAKLSKMKDRTGDKKNILKIMQSSFNLAISNNDLITQTLYLRAYSDIIEDWIGLYTFFSTTIMRF